MYDLTVEWVLVPKCVLIRVLLLEISFILDISTDTYISFSDRIAVTIGKLKPVNTQLKHRNTN